MRKTYIYLQIFSILLLLVGCSSEKDAVVINDDIERHSYSVEYDSYQRIFNNLSKELNIEGFALKNGSLEANVTIVEPELTFGKRSYLTLDGTFNNNPPRTTQEILIYENESQDKQIIIKLSFTKIDMDNDLINYSNDLGYNGTNQKLIATSDLAILAYKNLIIIVQQIASDSIESVITESFIKGIINILEPNLS